MSRITTVVPKNEGVQRSPPRIVQSLVIAAGETVSDNVDVRGDTLVGIVFPDNWTDADLSFQVSYDDGETWHTVYNQTGTLVKVTGIVAGAMHAVPAASLMSISSFRLVSSVAQSEDVTLDLILLS